MSRFKKMAKKAASIFISLTTTVWLAGAGVLVPLAAHGQTVEDLQNQIASLLATINGLQAQLTVLQGGGSVPAGTVQCTFTRNLFVGVQGEDVKCLQQYLNSAGHTLATSGAGSPGSETMYFGPITRAAVSKWQAANGVSPTAGYFGPISKAKYSQLLASAPPVTTPPGGTTPPPATGATGSLSLAAGSHPAATLAPQNAIHIPFTAVRFTATGGDVVVDSVTVERGSLANDAVFSGIVILDENMMPVTQTPKTLNSVHQAILPDDFTIPAGQTKTYYLAGNMAANLTAYAGQVATIKLVSVNTASSVTGSLPIEGTGHTINATLNLGSVTLTKGALDPGTGATKEVGTTGYTFSSIKATAGSNEDVTMKSIRWYQSGSVAKNDLENLMVVIDGTDYPVTVSADGKYYVASFGSGVVIKKGENKDISIKGDIVSGSNRTIDFDIFRYDDLVFMGNTFNYRFQPSATDSGDSSTDDDGTFQATNPVWDAYEVTVGTGSLLVEKSNDVSAGNIANGADGVALGAFNFEAKGEAVSFTSWVLTVTTTDADSGGENATLTNITVYDSNGNAVAGPKDLSGATTITFTDTVTVPVGDNVYTVRGNLNNNWEDNDTIVLSFNPATAITSVTGDQSGNSITPTPSATVSGNTQTVRAGGLVVSPAASLSSQNVVTGSVNVELGRFTLDASGSAEDLRITTIQIRADVTTMDIDAISNLKLYDGSIALNTGSNVVNPSGNTAGADANLTFTLNTPGLIVPAGTSKTISLKGNPATSITAGHTVKFDFSAGSPDWTVTGKDSTAAITETLNTGAGATMTFRGGGGWTVAVAPSAPTEKWVTAGATGVTLNVLRLTSTTEEFSLTDLRLQLDTTGSSTAADFAKISLYDGATLLQSKIPAFTNGVEDFTFPTSGAGSFTIPKDSFKELIIKADLAKISASQSGTAGQFVGVDFDGATSSKNKALGKGSGSSVHTSTAADATGNGIVYFRSVPTLERVAVPVTSLTSGNHVLYKFKVTADPAYDVAIHKFMFKVSTTGITSMGTSPANFTLWNITDNKRAAAATGTVAAFYAEQGNVDNSGNLIVRIYADTTDYTNTWVTIPAGQTHTFELRGDVTTDGSSDSVSTRLLGDDARSPRLTLTGSTKQLMQKVSQIDNDTRSATAGVEFLNESANVASSSSFIWTDFSSDATTTHSLNTADWMNGFKLPGLLSTGLDSSTLSN